MPDRQQGEVGEKNGRLFHGVLVFDVSQAVRIARFESVSERSCIARYMSGTEKVPQGTCVTEILPNFRVNFLVPFASKPLF